MKIIAIAAALAITATAAQAQTYRPIIDAPRDNARVLSPVTFEIRIDSFGGPDFIIDRSQACSPAGQCYSERPEINVPGTGHCHLYVENLMRPGDTTAFSAACTLVEGTNDRVEVTAALPVGGFRAFVDLTENDHRSIRKSGPQALPPVDVVEFRVFGVQAPAIPPIEPIPSILKPFKAFPFN